MERTCPWTGLSCHGPLARYAKLWVAHVPGIFSPPPRVSDPDMHHGTCVTHAPWCMLGSLTSGFFWSRWWGKRSRHSRRMSNPQFYLSGNRPMGWAAWQCLSMRPDVCVKNRISEECTGICCNFICLNAFQECHDNITHAAYHWNQRGTR